jgi:hypothetical protein
MRRIQLATGNVAPYLAAPLGTERRKKVIGPMSALHQQALGVINVCKIALAAKVKGQHPVDNHTIVVAQAILDQAKATFPGDKVLAATSLELPVSLWTTVQTAMEMVVSTLPTEEETHVVEELRRAVERARKQ